MAIGCLHSGSRHSGGGSSSGNAFIECVDHKLKYNLNSKPTLYTEITHAPRGPGSVSPSERLQVSSYDKNMWIFVSLNDLDIGASVVCAS